MLGKWCEADIKERLILFQTVFAGLIRDTLLAIGTRRHTNSVAQQNLTLPDLVGLKKSNRRIDYEKDTSCFSQASTGRSRM